MNIILWILQVLLAGLFLLHSRWLFFPELITGDALARMKYVFDVPDLFRWFLGVVQVLGSVGLILPMATKIQPRLTPLAAIGLALLMGSAVVLHLTRGEFHSVIFRLVLLAMAALVAYGRRGLLRG